MKKIFSVGPIVAFAVLIFASSFASATPIVDSVNRIVTIGIDGAPTLITSSGAEGNFVETVAAILYDGTNGENVEATQNTSISAATGVFSGTGSASMGYSLLQAKHPFAASTFDVFFTLSTISTYTLAGILEANADGGNIVSRFSLTGPGSFSLERKNFALGTTLLDYSGTLTPGEYELTFSALVNYSTPLAEYMGGSSSYNFDFRINDTRSPVPEPSTFILLGAGLGGFAFYRRRSKK